MTEYDFRNLSPIDFEALTRDLLSAEFGVPFETYAVGPDGGIDIRHVGQNRTIVVQCKHRPAATKAQLVAAAKVELDKWKNSRPPEYYFVTSASLSPDAVKAVSQALGPLSPNIAHVWGRGRLNGSLSTHPEVERKHFKLWLNSTMAIDRILRAGEWERSESLIHEIRDRVRLFVHTSKYEEAFETLEAEGIVLISGAPGVGKSTLAEMLILSHWHAGWKVVNIIDNLSDAWKNHNNKNQNTIFYYDDFLGQTSSLEVKKNEGTDLGLILRSIQKSASGNTRFVMTTREQILNTASAGNDDRIRRAVRGSKPFRLEMNTISRHEKARMLFNHLYFAYDGSSLLNDLAKNTQYRSIVDHPNFNPRVLESVILCDQPRSVGALYEALQDSLDHPNEIWKSSFDQLSQLAMRIVLNLAIEPNRSTPVDSIESLTRSEDPRAFTNSLRVLENTWIKIELKENGPNLRLYDPSRRDFLIDQLESGPLFICALEDAKTVRQISYLVRRVQNINPSLIKRMTKNIDEAATERLLDELQVSMQNVRLNSPRKKYSSTAYTERVNVITMAVSLLTLDESYPLLLKATVSALNIVDKNFKFLEGPTASSLFHLAKELNNIDTQWASKCAEKCALIGLELIENADEISEYAQLPSELRDTLPGHKVSSALGAAFDAELDGITQQSDRDLMDTWLSEVEDLASALDVSIYTDSVREIIEQIPEPKTNGFDRVERVTESIADDDTNEGLALLFARLAHQDTA